MTSIWSESTPLPHFPTLEGDIKTDVLIIGGGITGILCAYFLQEKGVNYVLVEGRTICSGVTPNTTAKITSQHGLIYQKFLKSYGAEKTSLYLKANQDALDKYREICENISCDFQTRTAYVYSLDNRKKLEKEAEALSEIGFDAPVLNMTELPFPVAGAIAFENQAQFHPLKFISSVARNLKIYEHTLVKEMKEHTAVTDRAAITFQKVIFATHFPIDNKHGMYFLKLYQHRSYVIALDHAVEWDGMYVDEVMNGMSFRSYNGMLLIDLIIGKENPYAEIFSPSRNMMKPQLFYNSCEALKNLITVTPRRCPHMGCALQWNSLERSWDCPCHGSRFDETGVLLDNPANGDMRKNT